MSKKSGDKIRVDFRKNREGRTRNTRLTQDFNQETFEEDSTLREERITGKGAGTRQRTIVVGDSEDPASLRVAEETRLGLVLSVHGLNTFVEDVNSGEICRCAVRRLLKTLATDERHVVVTGDFVRFRLQDENPEEGFIERIEPRTTCLARKSWKRKHIIAANADQLVIVTSLAEPTMKPNLIDRMVIMAEKIGMQPLICVNKIDLGDAASCVPMMGVYARMGYEVILVSAATGAGIPRLRTRLRGHRSVISGQSGVGKSSLLNAVEAGLGLRTSRVSEMNQKGRHTTTAAELLKLSGGGYVVDTPGIRQFDLWDVIPEEVPALFRDLVPFSGLCKFQDCTHTHEEDCAVREAVEGGMMDERRFENFLQIVDSCSIPEY